MNEFTEDLQSLFGDRLKEHEPMAKHLNFRIGGPARWFAEVKSVDELEQAAEMAKEADVPIHVLGGGSNTLVVDEGFEGLVLKIAMRQFEIVGTTVVAEAGVLSVALARATANAGLKGFTWAISLPGTIGGAVRGNAGCFGGEMKDSVTQVEVFRDDRVVMVPAAELNFGYRESAIKHNTDIVLRVFLELEEGDAESLKEELVEIVGKRKDSQPLYAGSAGCIFKNYEFKPDELPALESKLNIPAAMKEKGQISAGWLIDQMDLKGKQIGDAQISNEHGNFIVNLGNATVDHIAQLIALVKHEARNRYGIQLEEEVKIVGNNG